MNVPRPGKKKARVLAKAAEEGRLKAQTEHEYKSVKFLADIIPFLPEKYKKNAVLWVKHIVEDHLSELPKGIALLGTTIIVKYLLDTVESLRKRIEPMVSVKPGRGILGLVFETVPLPPAIEEVTITTLYGKEAEPKDLFPEWQIWLIAFAIAYIIVEHGGQIALGLGEGIKGLTGIVGFLLG